MAPDELDVGISVEMTVLQWHHIDGGVDNEVSTAAEDGRDDIIETGHAVREAGWSQVAGWIAGVPGSGRWPPNDERATVTLSRKQWRFVVRVLDHWESVGRPAGNREFWPVLRGIILAGVGDEPA
ncbi:hypothetical protein ACF1FC_29100 [Streptomyces sp. NPDC014344]|uniref:hypothetical protein n=1 Tax=Streptomyces sp. NPDC014344 TaxID=3364871 RepID=UPI0036F94359